MPVTNFITDAEALTTTLEAEFDAPVARVWAAFTTPEQLSRFFGPPTWPATFTEFDLQPGGRARYHMTGPNGELAAGQWEFVEVNEGTSFTVLDSFTDDSGNVNTEMPQMRVTYEFAPIGTGTKFTNVTYFESVEALEQVVAMGAIEGSTLAFNQLDTVLHDLREFFTGKGTQHELLSDTLVRVQRLINGPASAVWRAYTEPELIRKWMYGPDGWEVDEVEFTTTVGAKYLTSWKPVGDTEGEPFGFEGELLFIDPQHRLVTTERMVGMPGEGTVNDLTFYEEDGATLLTLMIEYPNNELRDTVLATGMVDGMEASYARLESVLTT